MPRRVLADGERPLDRPVAPLLERTVAAGSVLTLLPRRHRLIWDVQIVLVLAALAVPTAVHAAARDAIAGADATRWVRYTVQEKTEEGQPEEAGP